MTTSIFIKTWAGDLNWLPYCLYSIKKYGTGFDKVIIVADEECYNDTLSISDGHTVISVPSWQNGYIQQQWHKLNADEYTDSKYILFVDSDCVFTVPFSPKSYMVSGMPILMKTKYGNLGGAEAWKGITSAFVGFEVDYEYMRRLPWMYKRSSLVNFKMKYPNTESYLKSLIERNFSEFNALGAYIDMYENEQYYVTDTEFWTPVSVSKQYWSWGGITPEILTEIESFLKD